VSERHPQRGLRRFTNAARELNRDPRLVAPARRTREWVMGGDQIAERLFTALGRPADLAAHQLAALRTGSWGPLGELGLNGGERW
jgi:hypothetical protein